MTSFTVRGVGSASWAAPRATRSWEPSTAREGCGHPFPAVFPPGRRPGLQRVAALDRTRSAAHDAARYADVAAASSAERRGRAVDALSRAGLPVGSAGRRVCQSVTAW